MNYGDFSATADAEQTAMSCETKTIPILPVRFSLLPYDLDNVVKPTSIDNPGSYLVRTLRRGFVYVYVEDPQNDEVATDRLGDRNWHIFRFDTNNKDVNGTYVPENTDGYIRADFKFSKYKWTEATADGNWVYDESVPPSSTIFVPCWASKIWLAYSEYRWPAAYFKECNDPSVRAQLMQPVNLRGTNKWAAKLANADRIVEEFKADSQRASRQVVTQLELSQVKLAAQRAPQRSHEQAALVALFDPLGDIKDAQFRISQMGQYISNITEAYKYPLTIGNFCTALKSEVKERDGFLDGYVGNKPAFRKDWEEKYLEIKNNILNAQAEIKDIIIYINKTVTGFESCSIGRMLHLANEYSKDLEACSFVSNIFGTALIAHGTCSYGQESLEKIILLSGLKEDWKADKVIDDYNGLEVSGYLNKILFMWSGLEDILVEEIRKYKFAFDVVIEAFSSQVKIDDFINNQNWSRAFNAVYQPTRGERILFKKVRLDYKEAAGFLTGTFDTTQTRQLYAGLTRNGEIYASAKSVTSHLTVDVPAVEIDAKLQMVGGLTAQKRIVAIQGGSGLLEVVSGLWVLAELGKANDVAYELFEENKLSKILNDDRLVIAATMASITDGLMRVGQAMRLQAAGTSAASAAATKTLFQGKLPNAIFSTLYSPALEASSGIGRAAALWLPRISAGLGAIVAGGAAYRARQTGDKAALIGNAMMAVSSLVMLVPGANAVVVVSAVFFYAIGFGISLLSYSFIEDVVRTSFWGSSSKYWDVNRTPIDVQIRTSIENLGNSKYQNFYDHEVAKFQDILWGVNIVLLGGNGKKFRVRSPLISEHSPNGLGFNDMRIFMSFGRHYIDVNVDLSDWNVTGNGSGLISLTGSRHDSSVDVLVEYDGDYDPLDWSVVVEIKRKITGNTAKGFLSALK